MYVGTKVFAKQEIAFRSGKYTIFVHEGGARSSKTTSIIQFFIQWAYYQKKQKRVIIARKKNTWTRATVLYDFISIMKLAGIWDEGRWNKTAGIIVYGNVEFWFGGLDDPQRLHGFTSDAVWLNEANEATKDDLDQLETRCSGFIILDYNPNIDDEHWIPASILKRPKCKYIHSTVLDNDYAPENVRAKIMSYEPTEANYATGTANKNKWEVYGLGIRSVIEGLVYENFEIVKDIPIWITKRALGMDFGYTNDVTAIVEVGIRDNELYVDEHCYKTRMLTNEIVSELKPISKGKKTWSESADPRLVDEIHLSGINIFSVVKGPGSIAAGIEKIKTMKLFVTERSLNIIKELKNYTYVQDKNGKYLNEPVDDYNHALDALRYVVLMELLGRNQKKQELSGIFY